MLGPRPVYHSLMAIGVLIIALTILLAAHGIGAWALSGWALARRSPDPQSTPDAFGLPYSKVTFPARDGVALGGRLVGEGSPRPAVIFCPGLFGSMDGDTPLLPMFLDAGFDVLQFDWRAHGASEGERGSLGVAEINDALGAADFLYQRGTRQIGLMGFSFGGAVALRAAARDDRIKAVVCDGGFVDVRHAFEGFASEKLAGVGARTISPLLRPLMALTFRLVEARLGASLTEAEPSAAVGMISPRPVFLIHGADDPLVPRADQDAVFAACGEPKSLWRVEGAGHREAHQVAAEEYRRRVVAFFREALL